MSWDVFNRLHEKYDEWFENFPGSEVFEVELRCLKEATRLGQKAGFTLESVCSTIFQEPAECVHIRPYPPKPELVENAGFACIRMRKPSQKRTDFTVRGKMK